MPNWFLGKIRYQQPIDDSNVGSRKDEFIKQKTITEAYLVDAVSYTDAEARLYQEIAANTPDFEITNITRMKLADVFYHDDGGETWFKVKAVFITDDEKTGKQKKTPSVMLVNAETPKQAYERVELSLKTALDPFEITDVNTTKILEIFPYTEESESTIVDEQTGEVTNHRPSAQWAQLKDGLRKARSIANTMVKGLAKEGISVSVKGPGESEYQQLKDG
ncbi:DUF4494 domain-containing protein [Spirosoma endbachense]|uniref:DUF4494 domain-containing protein n=1 Tax=Spirosoma endbachense TaxID=2666025 RepID=UPI0037430DDD